MATSSQVVKTITVQLNTKDSKIKIDGITKGFVEAGEAAQNFSAKASQGFSALAAGANNARSATGSASATVLEAGRVVSDFNYGIRGVANNLSQLANNFIFTAEKAGGLAAGLADIGKAFMGPLGIILAINVVIAAFERYSISTKKAKKETEEFNKALKDDIAILKIYRDALADANLTLEERAGVIKGLALLDKDLNDKLKEAANDTEKLKEITEDFLRTKERELQIDLKRIEIQELYFQKLDARAKRDEVQAKIDEANFIELTMMSLKFGGLRKNVFDDLTGAALDLNKVESEYNKVLEEYLKLLKDVNIEEQKSGGNARSFKQKYLDFSKIILGFEKREELGTERVERNKLEIKQKYERQDLQLRKDVFLEKERLRYNDFISSNASEEQKSLATKRYMETRKKANEDYYEALTKLASSHFVEMEKLDETQAEELIQSDFELQRRRLDLIKSYTDESMIMNSTAANSMLQAEILHEEKRLSRFEEGSFERAQAENKLSMMRMELQDNELEHELMIIDLKMKAQLEYVDFVSGIGQVFATLGKENEALAKVGLVLQKGAAIAGVVIENTAANQAIMSAGREEAAEYKKKAAAAPPGLGQAVFGAAAKAALIGAQKKVTKNNIGAGIAIANILATTLASKTMSGGGGRAGGDEGGGRAFDFNLVGSTGTNQLAEAVGGQFQQPVQAYVVSSEMTSQQELDLQIEAGASVGD